MRLLVLTHTFPPSRVANAKRPGYLVRAFLTAGWQVDVITSRIGMEPGEAETITHPHLRVIRLADPIDQIVRNLSRRPALQRAVQLVINGLMWPDEYALWSLRALRAARKLAPHDRVLAFVIPASMFLSGLPSRLVDSHWVFDLQESVTPQYRLHPRRSMLHRAMLPLLAKLERRALHKAGRVVFTADTNRRACIDQGLVPEIRTAHVPYFYDAEAFRVPAKAVSEQFQIVYLGVFDWRGARSPETFLRALAKFLEKRPEARPRTNFLFHGHWLPEHNRFIEELKLTDVVTLRPPVPYEEYIHKLKESPILLLVVAGAHNLFMPSKIVDYFGARRPILAFVPRDSEMRRVLEQAGMTDYACDEADVAAGAASLERLWQRYQSATLDSESASSGFWSSGVQAPKYLGMLSSP